MDSTYNKLAFFFLVHGIAMVASERNEKIPSKYFDIELVDSEISAASPNKSAGTQGAVNPFTPLTVQSPMAQRASY